VPKLVAHNLSKTFRTAGKWSWLAALQDDGTDDDASGAFTKAWLKREVIAFSDVNFSLDAGQALGVIGPGKTSLLRVLAGLTAPTTGYVSGEGSAVYMNGLRQAPYPKLSLRANLEAVVEYSLGRRAENRRREASIEKAAEFLDMRSRLDTASYWFHPNQFGSLAYATIVAYRPEIMLFDEILQPGEPEASEWFTAELRQHLEAGGIVVIASRRDHVARTFSPTIYDLGDGETANDGDAADDDELDQSAELTMIDRPPPAQSQPRAGILSETVVPHADREASVGSTPLYSATDGYFLDDQGLPKGHDAGRWQPFAGFTPPVDEPDVQPDIPADESVVGVAGRQILSGVPGLGMLRAVRTRTPSGREINQVNPGETVVVDVYFDVLGQGVGVDIVATFSVVPLGMRRQKFLATPNRVAVARLTGLPSSLQPGNYLASCDFDGQLMREARMNFLITADVSVTFRDEHAEQLEAPATAQSLDAKLHWIVRKDGMPLIHADNPAAARMAALYPELRWEVKYDVSRA
jgi:ABC-type polysaccharide/polyol phosphate transport system ATPase subunit